MSKHRSKLLPALCRLVLFCGLPATCAHAGTIVLGYLEFDLDTGNNLYLTTIGNQTGISGCTPSYPVCDPLRFLNGSLLVDYTDGSGALGSLTVSLSNPVDSGTDLPAELQFDGALTLLDATFQASLDSTSFLLFDGSTFSSDGEVSGAGDLTGDNFFFLSANSESPAADVPEPAAWCLLPAAVVPLIFMHRRRGTLQSKS